MSETDMNILLRELNTLHRQLSELAGRLRKGGLRIKVLQDRGKQKETEYLQMKEEYRLLVLESKKRETELQTNDDLIKRRKTQLGEAKTNREYLALKEQIALDMKSNDSLAEVALEAMTEAEEFEKKVQASETAWQDAVREIEVAEKAWIVDRPIIEEDAEYFTQKLKEKEACLNKDFHPIYMRLVEGYGGETALSAVINGGYCTNCMQKIPMQFVNDTLGGHPVVCSSCGRLLFIPEGFSIAPGK